MTVSPGPLLERLDGLILAGGADVDPASYGHAPAPNTTDTRPERDQFELGLAKGALETGLPVLGICRGFQLINVAAGGTLDQHLPDRLGHERHRTVPGRFDEHEVVLTSGSRVAAICGEEKLTVSSHHHQGLDRIGDGIRVTGLASTDRIPEALEVEGKSFAIAVQWHPEIDPDDSLVAALVDAARARMDS